MNNQFQNQIPNWNYNTNMNGLQYPNNYWNPQRLPVYSAIPIHGENAAWQFPMGPNSEIYLPDADEDIIWWIRTDNVGNRTVEPFDVTPHKKQQPVNIDELVTRLAAVEEWINAKQNKPNAKRNNSASANPNATAISAESIN